MAAPVDQQFFARLSTANARFGAGLPGMLDCLADMRAEFNPAAPDAALAQQLQEQLHTLAGSAATFGFRVLGHEARALEQRLRVLLSFCAVGPHEWSGWLDELDALVAWSRRDPRAPYYKED